MVDLAEFDRFFEACGYADGDEPQAFADWLASRTGEKVVGLSEDGAVEGRPDASRGDQRPSDDSGGRGRR